MSKQIDRQIIVFGEIAKSIKPGDIFTPSFDSVEGHDRVVLKKNNEIKVLLEMYDTQNIGLDKFVEKIRELVKN